MSFTLKGGLSTKPGVVEFADYWEIECLKKVDFSISLLDLIKGFGIADDIQETEADKYENELEEEELQLVGEIERRIKCCAGRYPFKLNNSNYVLSLDKNLGIEIILIYVYLLLATRNDMSNNKTIRTYIRKYRNWCENFTNLKNLCRSI